MLTLEDKEKLEETLHLGDEIAFIELFNGNRLVAYYWPEETDKYELSNAAREVSYYETFQSLWEGIKENLNGKRVKAVF